MNKNRRTLVNNLTIALSSRRKIDGASRFGLAMAAIAASGSLFATPTADSGTDWQDPSQIESAASLYIKERISSDASQTEVHANPLDPRLRLAHCDQQLEAFLRPGTQIRSRTIVGVRCTGSRAWKVYVPVDLIVTAAVLTPKRALRRGHVITAADLTADHRDVSRMHSGYFTRPEELVGQLLKVQLPAGRVITPSVIKADMLIRQGQTVTLSVADAAISIRMSGKALEDGGLHQRIRVKNSNSGRVVEGLVRSPEHVEVLIAGSAKVFSNTPKVSAAVADTRLSNNDR